MPVGIIPMGWKLENMEKLRDWGICMKTQPRCASGFRRMIVFVVAWTMLSGCTTALVATNMALGSLSPSPSQSGSRSSVGLSELCREISQDKSGLLPVSGYRILEKKNLEHSTVPGFSSAIDFYASFQSRNANAYSVVEAIQTEISLERLPIFLEFQSLGGSWKSSSFDFKLNRLVTIDVQNPTASHGLVFEQIPTENESNAIVGVSITVVDMASGNPVAKNIGLVQNPHSRTGNQPTLFVGQERCGYPAEENFVGAWLSALVRKYPAGTTSPYNQFRNRIDVPEESRRWAGNQCTMPTPENWYNASEPNIKGRISYIEDDKLDVLSRKDDRFVVVHIPTNTSIYDANSGRKRDRASLVTGEDIFVWYENCQRIPRACPKFCV